MMSLSSLDDKAVFQQGTFAPLFMAFVLVLIALTPSAFAADCTGAAVPPSLQSPGRPASGVVTIGDRIVLIDDAGPRKQLLVCAPEGSAFVIKDRIDLGEIGSIGEVAVLEGKLRLKTEDGKTIEKIIESRAQDGAREGPAPSGDGFRQSTELQSDGSRVVAISHLNNSTPHEGAAPATEIRLTPVVPGTRVFSVKVLNVDEKQNTITVFWDEVGRGTRAFIAKYQNGKLASGAEIPLDDIESLPENFAGALSDGRPYYLQTRQGQSIPVLLELDSRFRDKVKPNGEIYERLLRKSQRKDPKLESTPQKDGTSGRPGDTAQNDSTSGRAADGFESGFQAAVRVASGDEPRNAAAAGPSEVSRDDVVQCAEMFRDLVWTVTPGSYQRANVPNECDPPSYYWRRPSYIEGQSGQQVTGVPYCWGCSDSIEKFTRFIQTEERLAGHSCTCRTGNYCLRSDVTGVDCSGFISQCWRSGYYTTSSMGEIANDIDESELKKGDAFNQPGSHIRLYMETIETSGGSRYRVIEAANGQGRIGRVTEAKYTASQLSRYHPVRYKKIVD